LVVAKTDWDENVHSIAKIRNTRKLLNALRATLFVLLTFGHDCGTEAAAEILGQFIELRITINLDGLLSRVANHVAVVAPGEMVLQLDFCSFVEYAVQIIR
jgi:hypothetical protein